MGRPKFPRKKYSTPKHPWKEERIKTERELIKKYGLKNHKEVWKAKTLLSKYRGQARELLAKTQGQNPQIKKESDQLLLFLTKVGILPTGCSLDDVLALETETILSRRLQTLVYLKGFGSTIKHSRQLITHGHISVNGRKVTIPGYMVKKDEEKSIIYTEQSPLNTLSHPARPKSEVAKITPVQPEKISTQTKSVPLEPTIQSEKKEVKTEETNQTEPSSTDVKNSSPQSQTSDIKPASISKEEKQHNKKEKTKKSDEHTDAGGA